MDRATRIARRLELATGATLPPALVRELLRLDPFYEDFVKALVVEARTEATGNEGEHERRLVAGERMRRKHRVLLEARRRAKRWGVELR